MFRPTPAAVSEQTAMPTSGSVLNASISEPVPAAFDSSS